MAMFEVVEYNLKSRWSPMKIGNLPIGTNGFPTSAV